MFDSRILMERDEVVSSSIRSVGYDLSEKTMEVEFSKGQVYQYFDVPESTYNSLMVAVSIGSAFDELVRRGGFSFEKVG
tara:strand:- start:9827 stop:10063 length:237 start_codon:yes stop_codon:yes gene_type:complete